MSKLALYARVSTTEQSVDNQVPQLVEYAERRGVAFEVFADEGVSGCRDRRPELDRLPEAARRREVEVVVCVKLDRLARSVRHLVALTDELEVLGVDLVVLDQAIDTGTPAGRLLFHMLGAIGEFERDLIVERTRAGVARARREGRSPGRPPVLAREQIERIKRLHRHGHSQRRIAEMLRVSKSTVLRALRERAA